MNIKDVWKYFSEQPKRFKGSEFCPEPRHSEDWAYVAWNTNSEPQGPNARKVIYRVQEDDDQIWVQMYTNWHWNDIFRKLSSEFQSESGFESYEFEEKGRKIFGIRVKVENLQEAEDKLNELFDAFDAKLKALGNKKGK